MGQALLSVFGSDPMLKRLCISALSLAAIAGLPSWGAAAEAVNGVYIGLGAGGNYQARVDIDGATTNANADFALGFAGVGSVGYAFKNGVRLELEGSYRENDVDSVNTSGVVTPATQIERSTAAVMMNVAFDYHNETRFVPSLGAGIGLAAVSTGDTGDDVALAGQAMAGIGYKLNDRLTLFADYRLAASAELDGALAGESLTTDNVNHSLIAGIRINLSGPFGGGGGRVAEDPAGLQPMTREVMQQTAAVPAASVPTDYLVFFDTNVYLLSPRAQGVVKTAAANMQKGSFMRINVTGHTDTVGSKASNLQLSQQRANSVRQLLMVSGIAENEIIVLAKGETDPLINTPDGRAEAQNRRVAIVLN